MEERTGSSSTVIQDLIPAISMSLGQLRRSPGKDEGWVEAALRTLEKERPPIYDRLRRRLGFALRLSELATLDVHERAVMTLGLFFNELAGAQARDGARRPSRPWVEYLLRNEYWLAHSYYIAEALDSPSWSEEADRAIVVAKVAVAFDVETLERHSRPLVVMQQMFVEANTPAAEQIIPILWTEDGQELCDHHFRRQAYRVDVQEIKHAFEVLKRVAPRPLMDEPAAPMRFSTRVPATTIETQQPEREEYREPIEPRRAPPVTREDQGVGFERQRQALRAGPGWGALLGDPSQGVAEHDREVPTFEEPAYREPEDEAWEPPVLPAPEPLPVRAPAKAPEEVPPMTMRSIPSSGASRNDHVDISAKVEELRVQLEKIQRTAMDAQRVLDTLTPQIEEFGSWAADLEAVVGRWRARDEREERVA